MGTTHQIQIQPDGSFSPPRLDISPGDTVVWMGLGRTDAIIPVTLGGVTGGRPKPRAYTGDGNDFTGPLVRGIPGAHMINQPRQAGWENGEWVDNSLPAWTWKEPGLSCFYIRLEMDNVNPAPGVYDWRSIDPHIDNAVRHGKFWGTSIKTGRQAMPQWMFDPELGAQRCRPINFPGIVRTYAAPHDPRYQHWYFEMMKAFAEHIKSRADWYQRMVAIRVSGANGHSAEASLPKTKADDPKTATYNQLWAQSGYTPERLYDFYGQQAALLTGLFPGKDICYPLIQAGFPRVNASDPSNLPGATEQTTTIIRKGREALGDSWVVQHLGLQVRPKLDGEDEPFPGTGWHPITRLQTPGTGPNRYHWVGSGFPNRWALAAGVEGSPTAWQTAHQMGTNTLQRSLENAWFNSDGLWLELYDRAVEPFRGNQVLTGSDGHTLSDWTDRFLKWRRKAWNDTMGDPYPETWSHTFSATTTTGKQKIAYVNPRNPTGSQAVIVLKSA